MKATAHRKGNLSRFVIEWGELRDVVRKAVLDHVAPDVKRVTNRKKVLDFASPGSWEGYSASELKSWVEKGFDTDKLNVDVMPPVREKKRYVYSEDADELHVDRALSGEDNYAGEFTKRVIIPGMKIRVETGFSASTSSDVVNAYNVFACQCISSLESAGIDCEIVFSEKCENMISQSPKLICETEIRIKRMNESVDFGSYSAFLSPASFRTFFFTAFALHADSLGTDVTPGLGRSIDLAGKWDIRMVDGELIMQAPYMSPSNFPRSDMEMKFKQALRLA